MSNKTDLEKLIDLSKDTDFLKKLEEDPWFREMSQYGKDLAKRNEEAHKKWLCPKGCGYNGIYYASAAHYSYGDW
jgi:hypothetical protein